MVNSIYLSKCTEDFVCDQTESADERNLYIYTIISVIGAFGTLTNPLSFYVFSHCGAQLNQKFIKIIKIIILNSFFHSVSYLLIGIYYLLTLRDNIRYEYERFGFELSASYEFMFSCVHIYSNVYSLTYAFGSLMDIYITWGRIQMFKPDYKFLLKTPEWKVSIFFLVIAVLLSIPVGVSRQVVSYNITLAELNTTVALHTYVYVANVLRDFITMTIEIVLNIMLVYFFSRFVNARAQLTGSPNEGLNSADKANTITTFILSILSICLHICTFTVFLMQNVFLDILSEKKVVTYIHAFAGLFSVFKNAINIFIFCAANAEFRKKLKFIVLDA